MKLIKTDGIYGLCNVHERIGNMIIGSSDHEVCNMLNYPYKLSIQNCENIFNGYDLDEMVEKESEFLPPNSATELEKFHLRIGFVRGARAILEILGDKKFSENDVINAYYCGRTYQGREGDTTITKYLQSLQQTEIEVEIVMEQYVKYLPKSLQTVFPMGGIRPKLDENGCIILKRK